MLKSLFTKKFLRSYNRLPQNIQKKVDKQVRFLLADMFYPSLRTKRMGGVNRWEARVDRSYRFTFDKDKDTVIFRTVGSHGLQTVELVKR